MASCTLIVLVITLFQAINTRSHCHQQSSCSNTAGSCSETAGSCISQKMSRIPSISDNTTLLVLNKSRIDVLKNGPFAGLDKLLNLHLYNNRIKKLEKGVRDGLLNLERLRLDGNGFWCNCQLLRLLRMLSGLNVRTTPGAICDRPRQLRGYQLDSLKFEDLNCSATDELPQQWNGQNGTVSSSNSSDKIEVHPSTAGNSEEDSEHKYMNISVDIAGGQRSRLRRQEHQRRRFDHVFSTDATHRSRSFRSRPLIRVYPRSAGVGVGGSVQLHCTVMPALPPPRLTWMRDGRPVSPNNPRVVIDHNELKSTLTISDVQASDVGVYTCSGYNTAGTTRRSAQLLMQSGPRITTGPQNQTVSVGAELSLKCAVHGLPAPRIRWFHRQRAIRYSRRVQLLAGGGLLHIRSVSPHDDGNYTCGATNSAGSAAWVVVAGHSGLSLLQQLPAASSASSGQQLQLSCQASGRGEIAIRWRKIGANLFTDGRHRSDARGVLTLKNLVSSDSGIYECDVSDSVEHLVARTALTVVQSLQVQPAEPSVRAGDGLVIDAVEVARKEVELAINGTMEQLFAQPRHQRHAPHLLLKLFRFPRGEALAEARAGEIFERTLERVKQLVDSGSRFDNTNGFSFDHLLSSSHVQLLRNLSGCQAHRRDISCGDNLCFHSRYRSFDGTCNNLQYPLWGASLTAFRRALPAQYENGFNTPRGSDPSRLYNGYALPNTRLVSMRLASSHAIRFDSTFTGMLMQWGQFVDHDMDLSLPGVSHQSFEGYHPCDSTCENTSPCFNIAIPPEDGREGHQRCMRLVRDAATCGSGLTSVFSPSSDVLHRQQLNAASSFIDASMVYGSDEQLALRLRQLDDSSGRLRTGIFIRPGRPLLPFDDSGSVECQRDLLDRTDIGCFLAGDPRVNEQLGLTALHTVWMREHNRVAQQLTRLNGHWSGERIYQEARRIVAAQIQHITYSHWLPRVLGTDALPAYSGYNRRLDASVANVFSAAAFRFGHALVPPMVHRLNESFQPTDAGPLPLHLAMFAPWRLAQQGGVDPILRGLLTTPTKRLTPEQLLSGELTERLLQRQRHVALDLAAVNMQRGRDHGLPGYTAWRRHCRLPDADDFDQLAGQIVSRRIRHQLRRLYGHVDNVDLWIAALLESPADSSGAAGMLGPTLRCLIADQMRRLRDADRFFYERPGVFNAEQRHQLRRASLARVLCDNGDQMRQITRDVFQLPELQSPQLVDCQQLPAVDLRAWIDCPSCRSKGCSPEDENYEDPSARRRRSVPMSPTGDSDNRTVTSPKPLP